MGLDIKNTNVIIKANEILGRLLNHTLLDKPTATERTTGIRDLREAAQTT